MQHILRRKVLPKRIPQLRRQLCAHICIRRDTRLVAPQSAHIAGGVPAPANQEQREPKRLDELDAGTVGPDIEVEATQPVRAEGVRAALQDNGGGAVVIDHGVDDALEQADVVLVVDAVAERDVEGVVFSGAAADVVEVTSTGEEVILVVLVEGKGHDAVGGEEGLLDAVAVVHVDVDVEHARVVAQELQDREHDVVDVAEPARFRFLCVVQPTAPVYCDVALPGKQLLCRVQARPGVQGAEVPDPGENGTVIADVEARELLDEGVCVLGGNALEEVEVVAAVELGELVLSCRPRRVAVHVLLQPVAKHELVCEGESPGFHRVCGAEVVVFGLRVVVVGDCAIWAAGDAVRDGQRGDGF